MVCDTPGSTRTSVAFERFHNGASVSSWAGDLESFGAEDRRAKKDRPPEELAACRQAFLTHFRAETGLDFDTLLGVISFHDVARAVLEEQSFENRMLKAYIRDWPADG